MKKLDNLVLGIVTLFVAFSFFVSCSAHAQRRRAPRHVDPAHLVLARLCAHEASLPLEMDDDEDGDIDRWVTQRDHAITWGDDCWLIHQVLLRGATRMQETNPRSSISSLYVAYAIAYSHDRLLAPPPTDGNRWAVDLHPDGHEPRGWHGGVSWSRARPRWRYVWDYTGFIVRMTLADFEGPTALWTCDEAITDWGGRMDHAHAESIGLIEVACDGHTVNTPYVRPGLRETP